jgi:hypothetical protein
MQIPQNIYKLMVNECMKVLKQTVLAMMNAGKVFPTTGHEGPEGE